MTIPLPFTWPWVLIFWPVYIWVFIAEIGIIRPARLESPPVEDRGSLRVVVIGFSFALISAFVLSIAADQMTLPGNRLVWFFIGLLVLISGGLLRRHCFRVLGKFFTGAVMIQDDHRVIDSGAYHWVRHPSYSAALLIILGIGMSLGNWMSVIVPFAIALATYSYRAHIEEQALLSSLGAQYAEFMARRKRFIPYVY